MIKIALYDTGFIISANLIYGKFYLNLYNY